MNQKKPKIPALDPDSIPKMKRFVLRRHEDESGNSGTGIVACGVMFPSGWCVIEWESVVRSLNYFQSIADLKEINGHQGKTVVEWIEND